MKIIKHILRNLSIKKWYFKKRALKGYGLDKLIDDKIKYINEAFKQGELPLIAESGTFDGETLTINFTYTIKIPHKELIDIYYNNIKPL